MTMYYYVYFILFYLFRDHEEFLMAIFFLKMQNTYMDTLSRIQEYNVTHIHVHTYSPSRPHILSHAHTYVP